MKHASSAYRLTDDEEIDMSTGRNHVTQSYTGQPLAAISKFVRVPSAATKTHSAARQSNSAVSDGGLIVRLKAGEEAALEEIFKLYSTKLFNVAQRILGDASDAEEVLQDVFLTAYRKANMFQGNSQFSTWLYRLTINAALGKIRGSKKHKDTNYHEFLPKFQKDGHHTVRPVVDWSDSLDEKYARHELQQFIAQALHQLKAVDKSVVVLSDLEGLSDKEIAAALNLTVSAVKTRLHRARLFLRGKLAVHFGHSPA
jgi:RNA polymerase sigma-70 factor (ECF subfamily)